MVRKWDSHFFFLLLALCTQSIYPNIRYTYETTLFHFHNVTYVTIGLHTWKTILTFNIEGFNYGLVFFGGPKNRWKLKIRLTWPTQHVITLYTSMWSIEFISLNLASSTLVPALSSHGNLNNLSNWPLPTTFLSNVFFHPSNILNRFSFM